MLMTKTTLPIFGGTFLLLVALFSQIQPDGLYAAPQEQVDNSACLPFPDGAMPPLIINEVLYNEAGSDGDEWVELYATSDIMPNTQFLLSDNEESSGRFRRLIDVPATGIPQGTYLVIHLANGADDLDPTDGLMSLWGALGSGVAGTALRNSSDNLTLYQGDSESDVAAIDYLRWGNDVTDATNDKPPDGLVWRGFAPGGAANEQSIARVLNGVDGSSGVDWALSGTSNTIASATPGANNGGIALCRSALALDKTLLDLPTGVAGPGDRLTYALHVENSGNITITELVLNDTFPPDYLVYRSASIVPDIESNDHLVWRNSLQSVLPFAPGAEFTVTVNFTVID